MESNNSNNNFWLSALLITLKEIIPLCFKKFREWIDQKKANNAEAQYYDLSWDDYKDYTFFIGRHSYIEKITDFFNTETNESGQKNIFLLVSMGGYGKTAIANQIRSNLESSAVTRSVYWVWLQNKRSSYDFELGKSKVASKAYYNYVDFILDLGSKLRLPSADVADHQNYNKLECEIRQAFESRKYLVVLDGLEESANTDLPKKLISLFSIRTQSKMLITSREKFSYYGNITELGAFNLEETKEYIEKFYELNSNYSHLKILPEKSDQIHSVTSGVPLRLKWFLNSLITESFDSLLETMKCQEPTELDDYLFGITLSRIFNHAPFTRKVLGEIALSQEGETLHQIKNGLGETDIEKVRVAINYLMKNFIVESRYIENKILFSLHSKVREYFIKHYGEDNVE